MRIALLLLVIPSLLTAQQATLDSVFADTSLFQSNAAMIRLYTDCDEPRWPWGTDEVFVPKSAQELAGWVTLRRALEPRWRAYFAQRAGDSIGATPDSSWIYPLEQPGRLLDNYWNAREGGPHQALDIFIREGSWVRAPASGVVIAAGDGWRGGHLRRRGLFYDGGGLSRRAGNGVLIFDPASGGYHYLVHFQDGLLVRTGDVVRAGQRLARVGHTGNASAPGRGRHLHYAYKLPATDCGAEDMLVSVDTYDLMRAARVRGSR